jgi:hypothetical protein
MWFEWGRQGMFAELLGKRPFYIPRRRWEDNIKMDYRAVGCVDERWIELVQDRVQWRALV